MTRASTLELRVEDASNAIEVRIDERRLEQAELSRPVRLDGGVHRIEARVNGQSASSDEVRALDAGEDQSAITLDDAGGEDVGD